jgi:hypothetical protein
MLKDTSTSFVSSLTTPRRVAVPSDDPEDSLPADSNHFMDLAVAPPLLTTAEPNILPPANHTWWHVDTGATDFCFN